MACAQSHVIKVKPTIGWLANSFTLKYCQIPQEKLKLFYIN